ncbi:hypothetical protein B0T14DRAFT_551082 [Immersiella caudata]|uniref:Uncharacterized protein n=1 Tax=Immersiella caudata TaxID=314043 RepID=A0AA40CDB4_9PEZI|nr:hypothetical protein B0T14DRAFT_551082 [Immersiella caudata]
MKLLSTIILFVSAASTVLLSISIPPTAHTGSISKDQRSTPSGSAGSDQSIAPSSTSGSPDQSGKYITQGIKGVIQGIQGNIALSVKNCSLTVIKLKDVRSCLSKYQEPC